jgi:hypothetical protein
MPDELMLSVSLWNKGRAMPGDRFASGSSRTPVEQVRFVNRKPLQLCYQ